MSNVDPKNLAEEYAMKVLENDELKVQIERLTQELNNTRILGSNSQSGSAPQSIEESTESDEDKERRLKDRRDMRKLHEVHSLKTAILVGFFASGWNSKGPNDVHRLGHHICGMAEHFAEIFITHQDEYEAKITSSK